MTDSIISIIPKIDLETAMRVLKHASSKKAQLRIIYSLALMGSRTLYLVHVHCTVVLLSTAPSLSPATMLDEAIEMGVIDIVKDIVNQQNSSGISSADVFQLLISIATRSTLKHSFLAMLKTNLYNTSNVNRTRDGSARVSENIGIGIWI